MLKNDDSEMKKDKKFSEMKEIFEKLFRTKAYSSNDRFTADVWFLKPDFKTLGEGLSEELENENKMIRLLKRLSGNPSNSQNQSELEDFGLRDISVKVGDFIDKVCSIIYTSHKMCERCDEQISEYKAYERKHSLEEKIKILYQRIAKETNENSNLYNNSSSSMKKLSESLHFYGLGSSTLEVSLYRLEYLPQGEYSFDFLYKELDIEDPTIMHEVEAKLKGDKKIILQSTGQIVNIAESVDSTFGKFLLKALTDEDASMSESSGSNFHAFRLVMHKDGEVYAESQYEHFVDTLLVFTEELLDISRAKFSAKYKVTLSVPEKILMEKSLSIPEYDIVLDLTFSLSNELRLSILKRIKEVFCANITLKNYHDGIIAEILDRYFLEISEKVKFILSSKPQGENSCDCAKCRIF